MKVKTNYLVLCVFLAIGFLSCDRTPITAPPEENITVSQGIPADEITWVSWKQGVVDQIKDRKLLKGSQGKLIKANKGGKVGGGSTFHNKVKIPKNALADDTYISVEVLCVDDNDEQCGAGVDFLPSMQFLTDVEVTLSWEFLDLDDDEEADLDFLLYYSEDNGATWFPVGSNVEIDYKKKRLKFDVDHFTRFAWGL
jgi:hypothetical protein